MGEIQAGEFSVIRQSRRIVSLGRVLFGRKGAETYPPAVQINVSTPFGDFLTPRDSLVFRGAGDRTLPSIAGVFGVCSFSKISPTIINTVRVYMIDQAVLRRLHDFSVHIYDGLLRGIADGFAPDGVESASSLYAQPFVFTQTVVVAGVHDGVGRLGEADSAESIPVARPAV